MERLDERIAGGCSFEYVCAWWEQGFFHGFLDRKLDVRKNAAGWGEVATYFELPTELRCLHQTHSTSIVSVATTDASCEADGWFGQLPTTQSVTVGIKTADCIPLILFDPNSRTAALLHCGWRGIVDGILAQALRLFAGNSKEISMAIGPGAGSCCYEIQSDLERTIAAINPTVIDRRQNRFYCDLKKLLKIQAVEQGIRSERIRCSSSCTICSEKYFSHRREKHLSGRQLSFIVLAKS